MFKFEIPGVLNVRLCAPSGVAEHGDVSAGYQEHAASVSTGTIKQDDKVRPSCTFRVLALESHGMGDGQASITGALVGAKLASIRSC